MSRFALDQALAAGVDPSTCGRLGRRARSLRKPKRRHKIAADIERTLEAADNRPPRLSAAAPLNRRAIRELRPLLLTLADDLRADEPVEPRGVAITRQLLMDSCSPLYGQVDPGELEEEVRRARAALLLI